MKIAFVTSKGGLDDHIAGRFGRSETFTLVEIDDKGNILSVNVIENPGSKAPSGAGIRAVQKLVDLGVDAAVGPSPGPHAYMALQQSGIKYYTLSGMSVRKALNIVLKELSK